MLRTVPCKVGSVEDTSGWDPSVPLASPWSLALEADLPFRGSKVTLLTAALALGPIRDGGTAASALAAENQPTDPAMVPALKHAEHGVAVVRHAARRQCVRNPFRLPCLLLGRG